MSLSLNRLVGQRWRQSQLHHLASQQPQGPVLMPLGRVAARQHNQSLPRTGYGVGFAPIVQLPIPVGLGMVVLHAVQSLLGVPTFGAEHRARRRIQGRRHLRSAPALIVLSRTRARLMTRAERLPLRINRSSWSRSSSDNRTAYFSATMDATPPAPLFDCQHSNHSPFHPSSAYANLIEY